MHLVDGGIAVADRLDTLVDLREPWFVDGARAWALAVYGIDMSEASDQTVLELIPRYIRER